MTTHTNAKKRLSRREFLGWAFGVSLVGLIGQAGAGLLGFFKPRVESGGFGTKIIAGRANEFTPGTVSHVQKGRFYISRLEDGGMLALWHRCTHLGCTVPWREDEGIFHCPCHSSLFNTKGEVLGGPAPRPLDIFPIEIVDGDVLVDTSTPIERDRFDPSQATQV
ncbi:MAG TPA: ubiquinol-cytochrome c reductase iron-sulfur subunit [Anaerolineae bacterium]|nr:ubiquinol-cytochrome c reductase iron-sulfur subunit [Anaerolineae bacterium]